MPKLVSAYYTEVPDPSVPAQRVAFGTSGHRGSSFELSFNEAHVLAITQAICQYRHGQGITGPLFPALPHVEPIKVEPGTTQQSPAPNTTVPSADSVVGPASETPKADAAAGRTNSSMTRAQESSAMPMAGQNNDHSAPLASARAASSP